MAREDLPLGGNKLQTKKVGKKSNCPSRSSAGTVSPNRRWKTKERPGLYSVFLATGVDEPADLSQWKLLLAGDVETNPGPKRTTVKIRKTANLLMGDSLIQDVDNDTWSIRAVHGGTPEDLRDWIRDEPEILEGTKNVTILTGGNSVCTKIDSRKTPEKPEKTAEDIYELVQELKQKGVESVKVLGIPKRRNEEDMKKRQGQEQEATTSTANEPPNKKRKLKEACKSGENASIAKLNDILRENEAKGYKFVGIGNIAARSCFQTDGVHLSGKGVCALAAILRKSCL